MQTWSSRVFYYVEKDTRGTVTLRFANESFTARNPQELRALADVTDQLSQHLKKLLQSGLADDCPCADAEAIEIR